MINLDLERIIDKMDDLEKCLRELDEYLPEDVEGYLRSGMRRRACEMAFVSMRESTGYLQHDHIG